MRDKKAVALERRFRKALRQWLAENKSRFRHPPYIQRRGHGCVILRFEGVIPEIHATANSGSIDVHAMLRCKHYDNLLWLYVALRRDPSGSWWCEIC